MSEVFSGEYAALYDTVYGEKNYAGECDIIERLIAQHSRQKPKTLLELGCGTGGHALPLSSLGYAVTGLDRSSSMLDIARKKAASRGVDLRLVEADIRHFSLAQEFDAAICMFAVLCYQLSNEDLASSLKTIAAHIKPDGLFIFDFWYGPAVLRLRPETRVRVFESDEERLIRIAVPHLDPLNQRNDTEYRILQTKGDKIQHEVCEIHSVRYFFPLEIEYFLSQAGLSLVSMRAFPEIDAEPDELTWNVIAAARKVS